MKLIKSAMEVWQGVRMWQLWTHMAIVDTTMHYRRSIIGPFWMTLNMGIMIAALGLVYGSLFKIDTDTYLPYLTAGFLAWGFISGVVTTAGSVFVSNSNLIMHLKLPLPIFCLKSIMHHAIIYVHTFVIMIFLYILFPEFLTVYILLLIPAVALYLINGLWVSVFLGMLCARYRDVPQIVISLMQVSFFLTPIFWMQESISQRFIIDGNVFYHFIEIMRAPMLGKLPSLMSYEVVIGVTITGWLAALLIYSKYRNRIVHTL